MVRRTDDTTMAIKLRLATYEVQTRPVLGWYAIRGRLVTIDGRQDLDAVTRRVLDAMRGCRGWTMGNSQCREPGSYSPAPGALQPRQATGMVGSRKS